MRNFTYSILLLFICQLSYSQLNMELLSTVEYSNELSDVWGWVDADDTEYAIVGVTNGVSIVSLADPANPVENDFIPGVFSTWRDLKTHGNFGYCIADQGNDGLLIMDFNHLPDSVGYVFVKTFEGSTNTLNRAHNIYIDEGVLFISGSNISGGGVLGFDLNNDPMNPEYLGNTSTVYSHDVYVRDNIVYSSEIDDGILSLYDINDWEAVEKIGETSTPFNYTHNAWLSDDSNTVFTTDELSNAPVAAYDISDPSNIVKLDEYRPSSSIGLGIVPHNVHVLNDYLIISYYADGIRVVDASDPANLVEVGNWDTFNGNAAGTIGCWGAYPYLPSGIILGTDMVYGLFVMAPEYIRASYFNGTVSDLETGSAISNASISIDEINEFSNSNILGEFSMGSANPGNYTATVSALGYLSQTVEISLASGETTVFDFELEAAPSFAFSGQVISNNNGSAIPDASIVISSNDESIELTADENGQFNIPVIFENDYLITTGKWGYKTITTELVGVSAENNTTIVELVQGYEDPFVIDLGWEVTGDANGGDWERVIPEGVFGNDFYITPNEDSPNDIGNLCFVTENSQDFDGVFAGTTTLTSPVFDLTGYSEAEISYETWFLSVFLTQTGNIFTGNDTLEIFVSNGTETVVIERIGMPDVNDNLTLGWVPSSIQLEGSIDFTENMQIVFEIRNTNGDYVEAAIDNFKIEGEFEIEYSCFISDFDFSNVQSESICDGGTPTPPQGGIDYNLLGTATQLDDVMWFMSEDPESEEYTLEPITHSGADLCSPETTTLYAYSQCDVDVDGTADSWILVAQHEVVVYPEVQSPTISGDGEFTVNVNCANDVSDIASFSLPAGTAAGTMSITVTQTDNACASKTFDVAHDAVPDITGLGDLNAYSYDLQIYPNPFSENFTIVPDKEFLTNSAELIIINAVGQEIYRQTINPQVQQIDLNTTAEMPSGIYFIQIIDGETKTQMQKIIKM